jgi:protein-S-isoprenylcysteine O-methyltransferase Ste14
VAANKLNRDAEGRDGVVNRSEATRPDDYGTGERRLAKAAVAAQVALLTGQALLRRRHDWPTPPGVKLAASSVGAIGAGVLVASGSSLGRGLTVSPLPNAHAELRTTGLYRHVRHPMYAAVLAMSWARAVASGDRRQVALAAALTLLFYGKSTLEESALTQRFDDYPSYAAATARFVPRLSHR